MIKLHQKTWKFVLCNKPGFIEQLSTDGPLDLRNIDKKSLDIIATHVITDIIRLYHITCDDLSPIKGINHLKHLELNWANKISDLSPITSLSNLSSLVLEDFPLLCDLSFLKGLKIKKLFISGGEVGKPLRLKTLAPIAHLLDLEELELWNLKVEDDDITILSELPNLKSLSIANTFDIDQYAFLAARLNSKLTNPIRAYQETNIDCSKCKLNKLVMITGKKKPFLCTKCDADKLKSYQDAFDSLVQ